MNGLLDHSDTPFGLAVRSLHFKRRTLSSQKLWAPAASPDGASLALPDHVLRNEDLLTSRNGLPISQVIENYTAAILGRAALTLTHLSGSPLIEGDRKRRCRARSFW